MSKIIAIANQKGGVAKTTTAQILALGLKEKGAAVLVLDLDPQMNLTTLSGEEPDKKANIYKVFKEEILLQSAIVRTKFGYDMVKGSLELAAADMEFSMIMECGWSRSMTEDIFRSTFMRTPSSHLRWHQMKISKRAPIPPGCIYPAVRSAWNVP